MAKSKKQRKGKNWVTRQNRDPFVKKARASGFRARAIYKLEQIDRKFRLIGADTRVVDLGSAPGSWSQYAAGRVKGVDQVVAVDLLPMEAIPGVAFIQGDFTDNELIQRVLEHLGGQKVDLVLSDMAPNITGIRATDQARSELIQESLLVFCAQRLRPGGALLTKLFEGEAAVKMRAQLKPLFRQFQVIKPDASRSESKEIFILAKGYTGNK